MNLSLAIFAGCLASLGSVCSKMPFLFHFEEEAYIYARVYVTILSAALMVLCNVSGLFLYTKSLQQTGSVVSTVTSTASNYIVSGFFGIILYDETLTTMWLIGTGFVILGLLLISSDRSKESTERKTD